MTRRTTKRQGVQEVSAADVAEFDREFVIDTFKTPSREARAKWERAKRKRGRPVQGKGAQVISVSVERGLLARTDRLVKSKRISRAQVIARGLRAVLAAEGMDAS